MRLLLPGLHQHRRPAGKEVCRQHIGKQLVADEAARPPLHPIPLTGFRQPPGERLGGVRDEGEPELPGERLHPFGGVVREDAEDDPLRLSGGNPLGDAGEGGGVIVAGKGVVDVQNGEF